jgi:hypothetical protein
MHRDWASFSIEYQNWLKYSNVAISVNPNTSSISLYANKPASLVTNTGVKFELQFIVKIDSQSILLPSPIGFSKSEQQNYRKQHPQALYYQIFTFLHEFIWEIRGKRAMKVYYIYLVTAAG